MKRFLNSAIRALLTLGGACLLFAVFANATPQWDDDSYDGGNWRRDLDFVAGAASTFFGDAGYLTRTFAVVEAFHGVVRGEIHVDYYYEDESGAIWDTEFVVKPDCLEVKRQTREAWIGGEVVDVTTSFGFPYVGMRMVFYVDDNGGDNPMRPDIHGSAWEITETCEDRPDPFFGDVSHRGKIVVR